jgi:hypothetical protein
MRMAVAHFELAEETGEQRALSLRMHDTKPFCNKLASVRWLLLC